MARVNEPHQGNLNLLGQSVGGRAGQLCIRARSTLSQQHGHEYYVPPIWMAGLYNLMMSLNDRETRVPVCLE